MSALTPERLAAKRARNRAYRAEIRQQILTAYGATCDCCGESHPEFLALDHRNGGGTEHRRRTNNSVTQLYLGVIRAGFPDDFRLLCHNCNQAMGWYGECPHERERRVANDRTL